MRKLLTLLTLLLLTGFVLVGCADDDADDMDDGQAMNNEAEADETDAMSRPTQMVVTDEDSLEEALGADGPWIIIFESDLTVDEEMEVAGEVFEEEGAEAPRRKLALYAQDSDRNVTERYTLTIPALVIDHVNTRIQSGTIAGDVYVEAEGFELVGGATIDGDLIFENEELQNSANIDDSSTVTGEVRVED